MWSRRSPRMRLDLVEQRGVEHRAVDADADVAPVARGDDAAEAGTESAGHPGLERELGRDRVLLAECPDRLEHPRRPAGVDLDVRGGIEEVGDQAVVTHRAV